MKTQEQKQIEILNYFTKTSQHLFVTEQGIMFKIKSFEHEGILYYSKLVINKDSIKITTDKVGNASNGWVKQDYKHRFFPDYLNIKSIKHFKKLNTILVNMIYTPNDVENQRVLDILVKTYKFFEVEESK